ncbi:MAG: HAD-IA family hydrolase [Alphaproteobacteria bacterium]
MTTILFDVDGVLIHGYHTKVELQKCWDNDLETDFKIKRSDFKNIFIKGPFEQEVLVGKKSLHDALQETLPQMGYHGPPQHLIKYWMEKDANVNHALIKHIETLSKSPTVKLYIATNQEHVRAHYLMQEVGFNKYFTDIFYAARLGALKPALRFYEEIERLHPVPKEEIIFFDDNQDIVDKAIEFGWEAHQFDSPQDIFKSDRVRSLLQ